MDTNAIVIKKGESMTFNLSITDVDGNPYELKDGEVIRFGVKKRFEDSDYVLEKTYTKTDYIEQSKSWLIKIKSSDTMKLLTGNYIYDIGVQSGENYYYVIDPSPFDIERRVTEWEAM